MAERKKYSKRYSRTEGESVPYRFTAEDGLVLQLLADYRYLDFPMLQTLLMRSPATLARRLQKMYKRGLVDRPRVQRLRLQMQNDPMVYAMANKGAQTLVEMGEWEGTHGDWSRKNSESGLSHLEHQLMIGRFRIGLQRAVEATPGVELQEWQSTSNLVNDFASRPYATVTNSFGETKDQSFIPDGYFSLSIEGRGVLHYFLEIDRGTMSNSRFGEKVRLYLAWYQQQGHQRDYGISGFQLLTLTPAAVRRDNLRETTQMATDGHELGRFLFACEACRRPSCQACKIPRNQQAEAAEFCSEGFSYDFNSANLLNNWLSAADQEWHTLLDGEHRPRGGKLSV